jgi:peptidyl-prolyl cis-trans isomerase C
MAPPAVSGLPLAVREVLFDRAAKRGLLEGRARDEASFANAEAEDAVIERLLELEVRTPEPNDDECRRYYEHYPAQFRSGDLVEASHILFALTPRVPPGALRAKAAELHAAARQEPRRFAELAREASNCPSAAQGGALGQLGRGDTVPEFERALFGTDALGVLPELVDTRFGFHVVLVARRIAGEPVAFDAVRERIAATLSARSTERALVMYLKVIAGEAGLQDLNLDAATSPLVQ